MENDLALVAYEKVVFVRDTEWPMGRFGWVYKEIGETWEQCIHRYRHVGFSVSNQNVRSVGAHVPNSTVHKVHVTYLDGEIIRIVDITPDS